jgi:protein SCO1/2
MRSNFLFVYIVLLTVACQYKPSEPIMVPLPFFNQADFTPEWIDANSSQFDSIHTIAPFQLTNQDGQTISNESIAGKIVVANFFFTICPGICPRMTENLMEVQRAFKADSLVMILSHTVMPWIDSVAQLKDYEIERGINGKQWHLLTGSKYDLYTLARGSYFADEGFGKTITTEADFLHTENLVLVDTKQRIRGVYNGTISLEVKRLIEDIKTLREAAD